MKLHQKFQCGFTLIEMIVVMVITGVLGGMIAIFINGPIQGYLDSARRAEMTDIADTAISRITNDVRTALPNSVRVWGAISGSGSCNGTEICYLEYLETIAGGRYNSATASPPDCFNINNASGVGANCTSLTTTGKVTGVAGTASTTLVNGETITGTSLVVVNNQNNNSAGDCSQPSAYCASGGVAPVIINVTNGASDANEDVIAFASYTFLPATGSSSNRFQIVSQPVTYVCDPVAGTLTRYWGYSIQGTQPNTVATLNGLTGEQNAKLASNVSACSFAYNQPLSLLTMLSITESGETMTLYNIAHVSNIP
jgi:MSHA biogenesis protein MshO